MIPYLYAMAVLSLISGGAHAEPPTWLVAKLPR